MAAIKYEASMLELWLAGEGWKMSREEMARKC
jgi:hypothetical protein